jgi:hypothetical protein
MLKNNRNCIINLKLVTSHLITINFWYKHVEIKFEFKNGEYMNK